MNTYGYFTKLSAHAVTFMNFEDADRFNNEKKANIFYTDELVKRVYKEVTLNNDKNSDKTFKYIDQFVNDVVQTKDTINGLKIHFGENATYNEFIEVLNIFNERNAELCILDKNTMYFVGRDWKPPSPDDEKLEPMGMFYCTSGLSYSESEPNFQQMWGNFKTQFNQNKIIYSAYIFLFLITIVSIVLKNKKLPK